MPKQKTHKGMKWRFKVTANGKVLRRRPGKRHLLSSKTGNRRRRLRGKTTVYKPFAETIKKLLGPGM